MPGTPSPPRRIVHVVDSLGTGGLESGLVNLARALDPASFRHTFVCLRGLGPNADRLRALGAEVEQFPTRSGRDRFLAWRLSRRLRALGPDLVHTRNFGTIDGVFAARLAGIRAIVHGEHGWDTSDPEGTDARRRRIRGFASRFVREYVCVSSHLGAWLSGHKGRFEGKVNVIINGVDVQAFSPREELSAATPFTFGTVGRLVPIKDQATLIDAFSRLPRGPEGPRLVVVGDGPLRGDLEAKARETCAPGSVLFRGESSSVAREYAGFDAFVLPSLNEGISNTILEAMACGLPVVATSVGGNPELVADGETGRLVPKQDAAALAAAMSGLVSDSRLATELGRRGRARAESEFSIRRMADRYAEVYRRAMAIVNT